MGRLAAKTHDPYWEVDGPTARREHRRQAVLTNLAFASSLLAFIGAGWIWAIHLGIAAQLGINARLPFGW